VSDDEPIRDWVEANLGKCIKRPNGRVVYRIVGMCHHKCIVERLGYTREIERFTGFGFKAAKEMTILTKEPF
jgi:hypothetical protein